MTRKVKVRLAVAVDPTGYWCSSGWAEEDEELLQENACDGMPHGHAIYWLTAELDIPESVEVVAKVETGK